MLSAYCASKAGVISLTQVAALEGAPSVRVNCVAPGVLDTPMQKLEYEVMAQAAGKDSEALRQEWVDAIPLRELQQPSDVASAVLFLASDAASQITGETLNVNGGWLMG
jgi:NAD(P)-dependent dehydrogenase (short-subunit alcohol dehydrogenase family)